MMRTFPDVVATIRREVHQGRLNILKLNFNCCHTNNYYNDTKIQNIFNIKIPPKIN